MKEAMFYIHEGSDALIYAGRFLEEMGYRLSPTICESTTHILLPIPTRADVLDSIKSKIPEHAAIIGGNTEGAGIDFLKDELYLAKNAMITAHCAIKVAMDHIEGTLQDERILITGWGRIGVCLSQLLTGLGCNISIYARDPKKSAMVQTLGHHSVSIEDIKCGRYTLIFNTIPEMILTDHSPTTLKIELASKPGLAGNNIITAKGLPGRISPKSSGKLIAETIQRYLEGGDCG